MLKANNGVTVDYTNGVQAIIVFDIGLEDNNLMLCDVCADALTLDDVQYNHYEDATCLVQVSTGDEGAVCENCGDHASYIDYASVCFIQGDESIELLDFIEEQGAEACLNGLLDCYPYPGEDIYRVDPETDIRPWGSGDHLYENDTHVLYYNYNLDYVGVYERV